ncbi:SDR family oxidoreductase [Jatrophihabitans telluris]|uniref:SDR family oxidoreductase n=1 Tax=Jatrophihabitans telluris TaxID=2038343 RepID=A0ABY4R1Q3_9ACTN|nr:SDR family NAD(P)-dependent oxidoreductase [Jatrophihabitans telluris]UQX89211.1 SDR family oxidoreductase [Jatrophihabitans telluris]
MIAYTAASSLGRLDGRRALVTGAARGMGRAHALTLAGLGASVTLLDLDEVENANTAQEIKSLGGTAYALAADVTSRTACERASEAAASAMGGLDILVHNAGLMYSGTGLADTDDEDFHRLLMVNVHAPLYLTRAALPYLLASDHARVVFVSSQWGQVPGGHSYGYMTAKAAQLGLMKTMATEFAGRQILVNAVTPGAVITRMVPEEYQQAEQAVIPIGRLAEPGEIASVVAFLAGDGASFITGQTIGVNGGACIVGI